MPCASDNLASGRELASKLITTMAPKRAAESEEEEFDSGGSEGSDYEAPAVVKKKAKKAPARKPAAKKVKSDGEAR